jgi:ABC-2 type transport system permease protein
VTAVFHPLFVAKRQVRLVGAYSKLNFLRWLTGASWVFTLVLFRIVPPLMGLAVWSSALPGNTLVGSYFVALLVIRLLTVSYENHTLSTAIFTGELTDRVLRPHPVVLSTLGENIAMRVLHVVLGLPVLVIVLVLVPVEYTAADLMAAVPAVLLAALLRFLFTYVLALTGFWTVRAHAVVEGGGVLALFLGGEAAPIPFLPESARAVIGVLPFRAMLGLPAEIASGMDHGSLAAGLAGQVVWIAVFAVVARVLWARGIRQYQAVGG